MIIGVSLFVSLFMFFFKPFGLVDANPWQFLIGYGAVAFVILAFNFLAVPALLKSFFRNWTVAKQLIWLLWIIFTMGIGNQLYTAYIFGLHLSAADVLVFQLLTLMVAIIPITAIMLISYNVHLATNLKKAREMNALLFRSHQEQISSDAVKLIPANGKEAFTTDLSCLRYIESAKNYIHIYYCQDGQLKRNTQRSTLKQAEEQLAKYRSLLKCHRAFIVNIETVIAAEGNSNGLQLTLQNVDTTIPVSQNHYADVRDALSQR